MVTSMFVIDDYGAAGNGTTNDTAAIQAAINAAATAGGGTVSVPGRTYLCAGVIVPSNVQLVGTGWKSKLRMPNGGNGYVITMRDANTANACSGASVRDMVIECNGGQQTAGGGIKMAFTARCILDHLLISEPYHAAVLATANPTNGWPFENTITNCLFTLGQNSPIAASAGYALDLVDAEENWIHSNAFEFNGAAHIRENVVGNNSIHNNTFVEGKIGIRTNGSRGRYTGNIFDRVGGHCFQIVGQDNIVSGNAAFDIGQGQPAGTASAVALDWQATRNIISGNVFISHGTAGQTRSAIQEMFNNTTGNLITDNHFTTRGAWARGATERLSTSNIYRGNVGLNPVGSVPTPTRPASGVALRNPTNFDCTVYVAGGTVQSISVGGVTTGLTSGAIRVAAGQTITLAYTVAPTWKWIAD